MVHINLNKLIHIILLVPEKLEGKGIVGSGRNFSKLKRSIFGLAILINFFESHSGVVPSCILLYVLQNSGKHELNFLYLTVPW